MIVNLLYILLAIALLGVLVMVHELGTTSSAASRA